MNLLAILAATVYAAESILSPLADDATSFFNEIEKPKISFGQLTASVSARPTLIVQASGSGSISSASSQLISSILSIVLPSDHPATPSPTPRPRKDHYTIAVLGDSMVDTLGPDVPHLKHRLEQQYSGTKFTLLNYGVGSTNIESGLLRITQDYQYLGVNHPSVASQKPDVVIVESFGYNPFPDAPDPLNRHWLDLAHMVDTIKKYIPDAKIMIAATIAPDANSFGDGIPGFSFDPVSKQELTALIKSYLDNAVRFAQGEHLPFADVYHASLDRNGNGKAGYINTGDHIHPSEAGKAFFARKVSESIQEYHLLE